MTDRQTTHAPGCWDWGPKPLLHREIERDETLLQALEALEQIARDLPWELTALNHIREKE